MRKRFILVFITLVFTILLSGCWDRKELNELAIVTGLAIDKVEEGYKVTTQILNPGEIAGQAQTTRVAVSTYEAKGRSVFEAIRVLSTETPRQSYFSHLRLVVLGEELAREGIEKSLDLMVRDHEFRTDFYLVVAKDADASEVLKILTPIDKIPTSKIYNSIDVSQNAWALTRGVNLQELLSKISADGVNPVLSGVKVDGDIEFGGKIGNVEMVPSPTLIKLDHLAVFKGDKLVGWLNRKESKGLNYITDNVKNTVGVVKCEGGNITFEVYDSKTDIKVEEENEKPKIIIDVISEATVGEVQCEKNVIDEEKLKEFEKKLVPHISEILNASIDKAKELESDIFGFGGKIHKYKPELWKKVKDNWDEEGFVNLEVEIKAKYYIRRTGTITKSFQGKASGD